MKQFHYFASHALGWATASTLDGAIEKLWHDRHTDVKAWLLNTHKAGSPGLVFFVCRVPLSEDANYKIEWYAPVVEGISECENRMLTYYTQKKVVHGPDQADATKRAVDQSKKVEQALFNLSYAIVTDKSFHSPDVQMAIQEAKPFISYLQDAAKVA